LGKKRDKANIGAITKTEVLEIDQKREYIEMERVKKKRDK